MYQDNRPLIVQLIVVTLLAVGVITLSSISSRAATLPQQTQAPSTFAPVTNPEVIENWLPKGSYVYTVARLHDYLAANGLLATSMSSKDMVSADSNSYDFLVTVQPQNRPLQVAVQVTNNDGIFSTSVAIDQRLLRPRVPGGDNSGSAGDPSYSGFDALVSDGISALQANELAQAFYLFDQAATDITINTYSIRTSQGVVGNTLVFTYTFSVGVDGKQYDAVLRGYGFLQTQLVLKDQKTGKQLFDSGIVTQGS